MTKKALEDIIVGSGKRRRNIKDLQKGELILIVYNLKDPFLAVFEEFWGRDWGRGFRGPWAYISNPSYTLLEPVNLNWTYSSAVKLSHKARVRLTKVKEFYIGKKEITDFLRIRDWDAHAQLMERLEQPYQLPNAINLSYIPLK